MCSSTPYGEGTEKLLFMCVSQQIKPSLSLIMKSLKGLKETRNYLCETTKNQAPLEQLTLHFPESLKKILTRGTDHCNSF